MKSLAPKYFEALSPLDEPAAYICVIRDIDRDRYRIEATRWPQALIDAIIAADDRSFGIELVSVLKTDDLPASEAELYARHHARLSNEWLELDDLQLEELRQSMLGIDAHASHYLTPARPPSVPPKSPDAPAERLSRYEVLANSYFHGPNRAQWKRRLPRAPIPDFQYGVGALRRNRQAAEARRASAERQRQERLNRLSSEHRIDKTIVVISIIVTLISLLAYFVITNMR